MCAQQMVKYLHKKKFCGRCQMRTDWHGKHCPDCGNPLRYGPRNKTKMRARIEKMVQEMVNSS